MGVSASERRLAASIAANTSWANTPDRAARTAPARRALDEKFLTAAGGDPQRAEHLRRAHFQRLALRSAQARRKAREAAEELRALEAAVDPDELQAVEAELEAAGGGAG